MSRIKKRRIQTARHYLHTESKSVTKSGPSCSAVIHIILLILQRCLVHVTHVTWISTKRLSLWSNSKGMFCDTSRILSYSRQTVDFAHCTVNSKVLTLSGQITIYQYNSSP